MKKPCISPAGRDEHSDDRYDREDRSEARCCGQCHDVSVPRETLNPDSALAKEMMRIKSLGDLSRMPVPRDRRQNCNHGEKPERSPSQKIPAPLRSEE